MTGFLINNYWTVLSVNFALLAVFCIFVGIKTLLKAQDKKNCLIWGSAIVLFGCFFANITEPVAQVYYDEFFYCQSAQNMRDTGRGDIAYYRDFPPKKIYTEEFIPPYPQGWPFLISLNLTKTDTVQKGEFTQPSWPKALEVSRILHCFMPFLLFLALSAYFSKPVSFAAGAVLGALPTVLKLSGASSAESPALFFLLLTLALFALHIKEKSSIGLLALILSGCFASQTRPECLIYLGVILIYLTFTLKNKAAIFMCWVVSFIFASFAALVMIFHQPESAHHFQAIARSGFTMWQNRWENIINNILFFINGSIWPTVLSVLGLYGLIQTVSYRHSKNTNAKYSYLISVSCLCWIIFITLFLSWFPFGDYLTVNSYDTWRFSYHIIIPMLILCALGLESLWHNKRMKIPVVLVAVCVFMPVLSLLFPIFRAPVFSHLNAYEYLSSQPVLSGCLKSGMAAKNNLNGGYIVTEDLEIYCFLKSIYGLPVVMAPISDIPYTLNKGKKEDVNLILYAVDYGDGAPNPKLWKKYNTDAVDYIDDTIPKVGIFKIVRPYQNNN